MSKIEKALARTLVKYVRCVSNRRLMNINLANRLLDYTAFLRCAVASSRLLDI